MKGAPLTLQVLRNVPIKQKLLGIAMLTAAAALLLSGIGIFVSDSVLFRQYLKRDFAALAQITAENSTAALAFEDPRSATETLAALRARIHLVTACVYRTDGSILARYLRSGAGVGCPPPDTDNETQFNGENLAVSRPVILKNRRIGTLVMLYDLGEIYERRKSFGGTVLGVLLVSTLIAFLLSSRLQAVIATPISELVNATSRVSETNDYSIRAPKVSGDELGLLVETFNEMLEHIQTSR